VARHGRRPHHRQGRSRTGTLDHHGEFCDLDFITPQWSPGPIDTPDPKVDVAAVNPWMLRMADEVAMECMSIRSACPAISHVTSGRMWLQEWGSRALTV
jgi:hypothetical protein